MKQENFMEVRMMRRQEVCDVLGISSAGLHRGMAEGKLPKPYTRWLVGRYSICILFNINLFLFIVIVILLLQTFIY